MNSPLTGELESMWGATTIPTKADELSVCGTSIVIGGAEVAVAYDSKARRHLLIPFADGERVVAQADWGALAFRAPRDLIGEGGKRDFLDVICKEPSLNGVFTRLGAELVSIASHQKASAAKCIETLEHWRELFVSGAATFSRERALGLLGELWMLKKLLGLDQRALATWLGPLGAIHDFRNRQNAIEVKSTLRRGRRVVRINGVEQLAAPGGGSLFLFVLSFISVPNGSLSLASLLADVRRAGVVQHQLDERLREIGYREGEHPELDLAAFELREATAYQVADGFPRIVHKSFVGGYAPDRVVRLEYDLDLSAQPPPPLSAAEADNALRGFLSA